MDLSLHMIGQSLLTGVMIGITTAVLLGMGGWILHRWQRHEQWIFLRDCIVEWFTKIRDMRPLEAPKPGVEPPSVDYVRWILFKQFLRELEVVCNYRLSRMNHAMVYDLRKKHMELNVKVDTLFEEYGTYPIGMKFYLNTYDDFTEIQWLRLPSMMPTE